MPLANGLQLNGAMGGRQMLAQFNNFRLQFGELPGNVVPSWEGGFSFGREPAHYRFYEHGGETYLTMRF